MMKDLLIITNNLKRASFRQRIKIHLERLRSGSLDCQVAELPSGLLARRKLFRQAKNLKAVLLHKKCLNFLDARYLRQYSKKIIYDFDDAVMYSPKTPLSDRSSHPQLFRRTVEMSDTIIAGNSYLAEHAGKFNSNVKVLPTGLNTKAYNIETEPRNDGKVRLVWIGSKSTLGYLMEIRPALERIGTRYENLVLRIVCDDFFDLDNMQIEKCQWSLKSQYLDLALSDIGLAPLPDNRFTQGKCGFKILQYQAANLPVVASPVGVNSQFVRDGITGYFAANVTEWVDKIGSLIEKADLRKQMGDAGKKNCEKFDSSVIGERLCQLIVESIESPLYSYGRKVTQRPGIGVRPKEPKTVSICIPTYNRREYLKETLESILAQTYRDYEIVIVDDGSTDGTEEAIKALNIPATYYWQANSGDAAARNKLVELAKGKYIAFIDSDDLLLPDAIEKMVRAAEAETEDVIVYGPYYRIDQNGKVYGKCKRKLRSGDITKYLFQTILVHSCGSMFPREILKEFLPFDTSLKVCSDYDLWLRLSARYRFIALPEPTFKRRRHPDSLSGPSFENCLTEFKVLKQFYYEKGGKKLVPEKIAMKTFSKEARRAGRCAVREGLYNQGCQLIRQSFRQYPNFKSLVSLTAAVLVRKLAPSKFVRPSGQ